MNEKIMRMTFCYNIDWKVRCATIHTKKKNN